MAEKLLGAIARGTTKAVKASVKQTASSAMDVIDPKMFANLYKAGLIGPLIKSIAAEYKKDSPKTKQSPEVQSNIVGNLDTSLRSMSSQLSAIADIMDDIREMTKTQVKLDKDQASRLQRQQRSQEYSSIEQRLESRPLISSLGTETNGKEKGKGFIGGIAGGAYNFAKDNPILSLLIGSVLGSVLYGSSDTIQKFIKDFREKSGVDEDIKQGVNVLYDTIKSGVLSLLTGFKNRILEDIGITPNKEGTGVLGSGDAATSGILGGVLSKLLIGRTVPGIVGGAIYGATDGNLGAAAAGAAGALGGGYVLKKKLEQKALEKAVQKAIKVPTPTAPPAPAAPSPIIKPAPSSIIEVPEYRKGRLETAREAKQLERLAERKGFKGLVTRIKRLAEKYGYKRIAAAVARIVAARAGTALATSVFTGPVGLVLSVLSVGLTLYQLSDILDDIEKSEAIEGTKTETESEGVGGLESSGPEGLPSVPSAPQASVRPPVSGVATEDTQAAGFRTGAEYEQFKQRVAQLESGDQNIANKTGSSAFGMFQILKPTYEDIKKDDPLLKDTSFEQMKQSPELQNRAFDVFVGRNAKRLEQLGVKPTPFNLYLAHRLGADAAARILKAEDPTKNVIDLAYGSEKERAKVRRTNPDLVNKSAGDFLRERQMAFGGQNNTLAFDKTNAQTEVPLYMQAKGINDLQQMVKAVGGNINTNVINNATVNNTGGRSGENRRSQPQTVPPRSLHKDELRRGISPTPWATIG